jgi:cyanophycinase-like exopeptidase
MTKRHSSKAIRKATPPGHVYLASSSQKKTFDALVAHALARVAHKPPRVAASYAASGEPHVAQMSAFLTKAFGGAEVTRFTVKGEKSPMSPADARAIVEHADVVFLSGGDPAHGAHLLAASGADKWIREAHARGAACMGMSAGAIMLGAFWGEWPDDAPRDAPHDGGALVPCARVVPELVIDCHAEEDHWAELALVRGMLRDHLGPGANLPRFLGLPTGSGLIVAPDRSLETVGLAPFRLV